MLKPVDYCLFSENNKQFLENLNKASLAVFASEEPDTKTKVKAIFTDISQSAEYKDLFATLLLKAEVEFEDDGPEEVELCLLQLKEIELRNELEKLSMAIGSELDAEKRENLKKEFDVKAKELHFKSK